jgi:hypothetical protein
MFELTFFSVGAWVVGLIVIFLSMTIFLGSREYSARTFAVLILFVAAWVINSGIFYSTTSEYLAGFFMRTNYFLGSIVGIGFYYFCLSYPGDYRPSFIFRASTAALVLFMIPLHYLADVFLTIEQFFNTPAPVAINLVVESAYAIDGMQKWGWITGDFAVVFNVIFFGFWFAGLATLYAKYTFIKNTEQKKQTRQMLAAMMIGVIPVGLTNVILPELHIFGFFWYGVISTLGWVSVVSYSIMKHGQMQVRAVYAEILVFIAILLLFVSIFIY